ncbi:MAG: hypothetical protein ACTSPY_08510 [Candidatus Helarchaeota archaeon]
MMVKFYRKILGLTGAPVHEIIVEESIKLLPEKIKDFLSEKIPGQEIASIATIDHNGNWRVLKRLETSSLAELVIEGARAEDQSYRSKKHYVDDSPINSILEISVPGLAHYWCYNEFKKKKKDIGLLPIKKVKTPFWWIPGINVVIKKILQGLSRNNTPYQSALSRARIYWIDDIQYKRQNYDNLKIKSEIFLLLGRVLHLLTDVGVPAHINCDTHIPWFDPDSFEFNVGFWMNENKRKWKSNSDMKIIFNNKWKNIVQVFITFAEISSLFDSDDVNGMGKGIPYRWEKKYRLGISGYLNKYACKKIGNIILPLNFQLCSGLILLFFKTFFPSFWRENEDEFLKNTTETTNVVIS